MDVSKRKLKEIRMSVSGAVDAGVKIHQQEFETYSKDPYDPKNAVVFSAGPFVNPALPGSMRGVVTFRSPLTRGLFVSSAGGLGEYIARTGDFGVTIVGRADVPVVVAVVGDSAGTTMNIFELEEYEDVVDDTEKFADFLYDGLKDVYSGAPFRVINVGMAALTTRYGALVSKDPKTGALDFFGRGGAGSVLVRAHNVFAVALGGDAPFPFTDVDIVEKLLGEKPALAASRATEKYRLVNDLGFGGTIVNWAKIPELVPAYNWKSAGFSEDELKRYVLEPLADAVESLKSLFSKVRSTSCGESCPAACKKILGGKKLDYEPMTAFGPQLGIFDPELALSVAHVADRLGFDAIEAGGVIAALLELRDLGKIDIGGVPETKLAPGADAEKNATAARVLLQFIAKGALPLANKSAVGLFPAGPSVPAFIPLGEKGETEPVVHGGITPPQYLVAGFYAPLPLYGKFMTYYGDRFSSWEELGALSWQRFHAELAIENAGFCRFHRRWAEDLIPKLYQHTYGIALSLEVERLASQIKDYQRRAGAEFLSAAVPPRSRQVIAYAARRASKLTGAEVSMDDWELVFLEMRRGISKARAGIVKG